MRFNHFFILLSLVFISHFTLATNLYVSTSGDDTWSGSEAWPYLTIQKAHDQASAGDTIFVRGGVYERQPLHLRKSGNTSAGNIVFINYPGEVPIISGWDNYFNQTYDDGNHFNSSAFVALKADGYVSYITIQGFHFTGWKFGGVSINWDPAWPTTNTAPHIVGSGNIVRYCSVDKCGQNGISLFFQNNGTIEHCVVGRTGYLLPSWSSGINVLGCGSNMTIRNNISFQNIDVSNNDTDGNGIIIDLGHNNTHAKVYNNICFNNGGGGISVTKSANTKIYNNTLWGNGYEAPNQADINFSGLISYTNFEVKNNIIYETNNGGKGYKSANGEIFTQPAQLATNNFSKAGNTLDIVNPLFDNITSSFDPGIQDISPMVDAGTTLTDVTEDNGADFSIIQPLNQGQNNFSNWNFVMDLDYVVNKGGLINCFDPKPRGNMTDIGAVEYANEVLLTIASPVDGQIIDPCEPIYFSATAQTSVGQITHVSFFSNDSLIHTKNSAPYTFTWTDFEPGEHDITVRTYNNLGDSTSRQLTLLAGSNFIDNPEFDNGLSSWELQLNDGAAGTINAVQGQNMSSLNALQMCPTNTTSELWHMQVQQHIGLEAGREYTVIFTAKAESSRVIDIALQEQGGTFQSYFQASLNLSVTPQTFGFTYTPTVSDTSAQLKFYVGQSPICSYIDNVIVLNGTARDSDADGTIDCADLCPNDPLKTSPQGCGCGFQDIDANNNGTPDCNDTNMPIVSITSPTDSLIVSPCGSADLMATASAGTGTISKVSFFADDSLIQSISSSPYSYNWANLTPGRHNIEARAYNSTGDSISEMVHLIVSDNLAQNSEFDNGTNDWTIQQNDGATGTISVAQNQNMSGSNALSICPGNITSETWHLQTRHDLGLEAGKNYTIKFLARASADRIMDVALQEEGGNYDTYLQTYFNLTSTTQEYTINYIATDTDPTAQIKFYAGKFPECIYLDHIRIVNGTATDSDNDGTIDCKDLCPSDPLKIDPALCGCGTAEGDCDDCHGDPNGTATKDICGNCTGGLTGVTPITDPDDCAVGLEDELSKSISIFPNPVSSQLTIEGAVETWNLYNSMGEKLQTGTSNIVSTSELRPGTYHLMINRQHRLFVKQ